MAPRRRAPRPGRSPARPSAAPLRRRQDLLRPGQPGFGALAPATRAVRADGSPDPATGALTVPIFATSTYRQQDAGVHAGYDYSRADNPTREALEGAVAVLEGATHGLAFASGMAAIATVAQLLRRGDHVVLSDDVYGGTFRLFDRVLCDNGIGFSTADLTAQGALGRACRESTRLVIAESPSNPLLKVIDLRSLAVQCRERELHLLVDNTFASPMLQQPLALGATTVVHSTTKYLGGHSDLIGGAIATSDEAVWRRAKFLQMAVGAVPSPFDCYLTLRGIKTLHLRMARHSSSALAIARSLADHRKVKVVHYPGLPGHPGHKVAAAQMAGGFGGMLSFETTGDLAGARRLLRRCKVFTLAESLGGVESLIELPALMTHASVPTDVRRAQGIGDTLIRLSVGIEDEQDLLDDLQGALAAL